MLPKIRILHLEDVPNDAELVERELRRGQIDFEKLVVSNKADFENALDDFTPDIVLSDHSLPSFDSLRALQMLKEKEIDIPFILVTSTMTEEYAVSVMKEGADDYILKDRLQRLPPAVLNAIEKHRLEREKQKYFNLVTSNEKRFRALIEKSPDMKTISTEDGKILYCSPSIEKVLGYTPEEFMLKSGKDLIHPDDLESFNEGRKGILQTFGKSFYRQMRVRHKNGNWMWIESTVTNMLNEQGIYALVSNFMDISKQKTADMELQEEQKRLKEAQAIAHLGSWEFTFATGTMVWSSELCHIYGIPPDQNKQPYETWLSFVHPEDLDKVKAAMDESQNTLADAAIDHRIVLKDLSVKYIHSKSKIQFDSTGKPLGLYGVSHDVTDRRLVEENLIMSESSLRKAQGIAQVGNWEIDLDNNQHYWSDEMYTIFGLSKNEVTASTEAYTSLIHPDDQDFANDKIDHALQSLENSSFDFRFIRKDGSERYGYSEWNFQFDKAGNPLKLFGIIQDITERKLGEMERAKIANDLIQRNKDLEQFAYIISHNLRAPVANIIGISNAIDDPSLNSEDKTILNSALKESVMKLDDVVMDLNHILQVKREISEIKEKIRFSKLVEDIKISIKNLIDKDSIDIQYDFSGIDEFITLKSYMYSIFYNLITNSIKYRRPSVPSLIEIKSNIKDGGIELVFKDNGMGIDLEKKGDKIFGLYKRFHNNIEGKGVGLYMVKTQVETIGGKISIESEVNKGTTFKIILEHD